MPHKTIAERLAQIEEQRRALKARLTKQERARDTRRKVLLGAFLLHQLEAPDVMPPDRSPLSSPGSCRASSNARTTKRSSPT
jgi:hypothetical protein